MAVAALVVASAVRVTAQQGDLRERLRVYLDCSPCDSDFVRTEIDWVDYVRDRQDADVHILVTTQTTGAAGREYTLNFIGRGTFESKSDTLRYVSTLDDTEDVRRQGIVRTLKMGLMRYLAGTPAGDRVQITLRPVAAGGPVQGPAKDRWNAWVFTISGNGFVNGESLQKFNNLYLSLGANRTTSEWKIQASANDSYGESEFSIDDTTTVTSIRRTYSGNLLVVNSMGDKLSAGFSAGLESSTYGNIELSWRFSPAVEYNFYPYSESTRRIFTATYTLGLNSFDYEERTIFGEVRETHPSHSLTLAYTTRQPWGTTGLQLSTAQFLHDVTKYRWSASVSGSVRLFKGLSLNAYTSYSRVRDQLAVPGGNATQQEILLRQRLLRTNYFYYGSFGLSYRFGSIFNTVVNPRFQNLANSGSTIIIG